MAGNDEGKEGRKVEFGDGVHRAPDRGGLADLTGLMNLQTGRHGGDDVDDVARDGGRLLIRRFSSSSVRDLDRWFAISEIYGGCRASLMCGGVDARREHPHRADDETLDEGVTCDDV